MSLASPAPIEVLHFTGYPSARGGVNAALRVLAAESAFHSVLGVHPSFAADDARGLDVLHLPAIEAERITPQTMWQARAVARAARGWLRGSPKRIFHGHSRAGLLVALWLRFWGERRALATVRALGRQRWFYRFAHRRLGGRMCWLGPSMKRHYGVAPFDWTDCAPDAVPESSFQPAKRLPRGRTVTLGAVGSLVPVKQWESLLRAIAAVPSEVPVRVIQAGGTDGSNSSARYAETLCGLQRELGLGADRWEWRGEVGDMAALWSELDCLVVASRWEASSMAALEAIAAGVPVLANAASGTVDLLDRTSGGWTFKDDADLAAQLVELATGDRLSRWRRDDAGLAWFGARRVAAEHFRIYETLLS